MGDILEMNRPESGREQEPNQEGPGKNKEKKPRIWINEWGVWRGILKAGGAQAELVPLQVPTFIDSAQSRIDEAEEKMAQCVDLGNPDACADIEDQILEASITGEMMLYLSQVSRMFPGRLFMMKENAVDTWKMGNRLDLSNRMELVVPESDGEDLKNVLTHLSEATGSVVGSAMEYKKEFARLETDDGFTVTYTYTTPAGQEHKSEIVIFYAEEEGFEEQEEPLADAA